MVSANGATAPVPGKVNGTSKPAAAKEEEEDDDMVIFQPLEKRELLDIAQLLLDQSTKRALEEREITLTVTDAFLERILMEGSQNSGKFGARPMRRAVQKLFEDPVSEAIITKFLEN